MIDSAINDGVILLKSLDRSGLDATAGLFCSNDEYRYAAGIASPVSCNELAEKLNRPETNKNEFAAGIYFMNAKNTPAVQQDLAGVVSGMITDKILWFKLLAILPEYRQKGIGSRAAALLFRYCKICCSISEVFLSVVEKNNSGVRFWLRQGFSEKGRISKELFDDRLPYEVIIMHKKL